MLAINTQKMYTKHTASTNTFNKTNCVDTLRVGNLHTGLCVRTHLLLLFFRRSYCRCRLFNIHLTFFFFRFVNSNLWLIIKFTYINQPLKTF